MFICPGAKVGSSFTAFSKSPRAPAEVALLHGDHPQVVVDPGLLGVALPGGAHDELGQPVLALVVVDERQVLVGVVVLRVPGQELAQGRDGRVILLVQAVEDREVVQDAPVIGVLLEEPVEHRDPGPEMLLVPADLGEVEGRVDPVRVGLEDLLVGSSPRHRSPRGSGGRDRGRTGRWRGSAPSPGPSGASPGPRPSPSRSMAFSPRAKSSAGRRPWASPPGASAPCGSPGRRRRRRRGGRRRRRRGPPPRTGFSGYGS